MTGYVHHKYIHFYLNILHPPVQYLNLVTFSFPVIPQYTLNKYSGSIECVSGLHLLHFHLILCKASCITSDYTMLIKFHERLCIIINAQRLSGNLNSLLNGQYKNECFSLIKILLLLFLLSRFLCLAITNYSFRPKGFCPKLKNLFVFLLIM